MQKVKIEIEVPDIPVGYEVVNPGSNDIIENGWKLKSRANFWSDVNGSYGDPVSAWTGLIFIRPIPKPVVEYPAGYCAPVDGDTVAKGWMVRYKDQPWVAVNALIGYIVENGTISHWASYNFTKPIVSHEGMPYDYVIPRAGEKVGGNWIGQWAKDGSYVSPSDSIGDTVIAGGYVVYHNYRCPVGKPLYTVTVGNHGPIKGESVVVSTPGGDIVFKVGA